MKSKTLRNVLLLALVLVMAGPAQAQAPAPDLDLVASTFMGGSSNEGGIRTALGPNGNVYVLVGCGSLFPTTPGAYRTPVTTGGGDFCVAAFDADLSNLLAAAYLGGNGHDPAQDIAVDSSGNVYLVGITYSNNYPTTPGAYDQIFGGSNEGFVTVLDPTLSTVLYSTFLGGNADDRVYGITLDDSDNVYVTGTTDGDFPSTTEAYQLTNNGWFDIFVSVLDPTLSTLRYSTFLGGISVDEGHDIALDSSGNVVVAGRARSTGFPTTAGAYDESHNGDYDAFVSVLDPTLSTLLKSTLLGGSNREHQVQIALDSSGNVCVAGHNLDGGFPTTSGAYDATWNGGWDVFVSVLNPALSALTYATYLGGTSNEFTLYPEFRPVGLAMDAAGRCWVGGGDRLG